ncbi:hypothetical protein E2C01_028825 [Portunus trituberculatus]|uniref:Uncharacterized protein n=1 Tax=Portunus trituberculatus TaxID=210409 RepID=A0A5B7ER29_PORTR|nr:hypothetical protein [Portunus trituberculatus]
MSEIKSERFKTMFTEKEEFKEPNRTLHRQGLQEITVHKEKIGRLLENLDVRKVMGPDVYRVKEKEPNHSAEVLSKNE